MIDIENYNSRRGKYSPLVLHNGGVYGFWLIGRRYGISPKGVYYYGTYPPSYLKRISYLFPKEFEGGRILHLFSGIIKGDGERVITMDIKPEVVEGIKPNVVGDAQEVNEYFPEKYFDLILADPPYDDNHIKYGTDKISRKKVIHKCSFILKEGGYLVWLDTMMPQWSKKDGWAYKGSIGLCQSTNHKVRGITILKKVEVKPILTLF